MSERNWFAAVKGGLFNQVFESDIVLVVNWDICKRPRAIMDDQQSNPKVGSTVISTISLLHPARFCITRTALFFAFIIVLHNQVKFNFFKTSFV